MIVPAQLEFANRRKAALARMTRPFVEPEIIDLPQFLKFEPRFAPSVETQAMRTGWRIIGIKLMRMEENIALKKRISIKQIIQIVAHEMRVKQADLISERRTADIVVPRQFAMWLSRELRPDSLPRIGRAFGKRDHTTVLHAVRKIDRLIAEGALDPRLIAIAQRYVPGAL